MGLRKSGTVEGVTFPFDRDLSPARSLGLCRRSTSIEYPLEDLQLPERRADDLDDLPERFKLLAHNEAKFGKDYNKKVVAGGHDKEFRTCVSGLRDLCR